MDRCPHCNAIFALVGLCHRCIPVTKNSATTTISSDFTCTISVTTIPPEITYAVPTPKRGRPPTGKALSTAERQRLYRARQKAKI